MIRVISGAGLALFGLAAGCAVAEGPAGAGADAGARGVPDEPAEESGPESGDVSFEDDAVEAGAGEDEGYADPEPLDLGAAEAEDPGVAEFLASAGPDQHVLVIEGMAYELAGYEVETSGPIEGRALEATDDVDGSSASGIVWVPGGQDVFLFEGEIESLEVEKSARVYLDGEIYTGGPKRLSSEGRFGTKTVEISIHSSEKLLVRNGRLSEEMVAQYAARAFEEAEIDYDITYNLKPKHPPVERSVCGADNTFPWWREQVNQGHLDVAKKDSNVLIVDARGGGCGSVTGNVATTPGRNIDERVEWQPVGTGRRQSNLHANLHEIGHNLGSRHRGPRHLGQGWNEETDDGGFWHRTPNVGSNGSENACGFALEERAFKKAKLHQTYSACAVERFDIK